MGDDGNRHDKGGAPGNPDLARATVRGPGNPLKRTLPLQMLAREEDNNSGVRRLGDESEAPPNAVPAPPETLRSMAPPPPATAERAVAEPATTETKPAGASTPARGLGNTVLGMPGISSIPAAAPSHPSQPADTKGGSGRPATEPNESERPARHTDPGPVAVRSSARPLSGRVLGDVSAAPVQPIGPKITISSAERPPIRRVTAPESYKVVDAPAESDGRIRTADGPPVQARAEKMRTPVDRPGPDPTGGPYSGFDNTPYRRDDDTQATGAQGAGYRRGRRSLPPEVKRKRLLKDVALLVGVAAVVGIAFILTDTLPGDEPDAAVSGVETPEDVQIVAAPPAPAEVVVPAGPKTRLVTVPEGAEVVYAGAVVASTPADVVRPEYASDYLIRKRGYLPQLVRLAPNSPEAITIELKPAVAEEAPTAAAERPESSN